MNSFFCNEFKKKETQDAIKWSASVWALHAIQVCPIVKCRCRKNNCFNLVKGLIARVDDLSRCQLALSFRDVLSYNYGPEICRSEPQWPWYTSLRLLSSIKWSFHKMRHRCHSTDNFTAFFRRMWSIIFSIYKRSNKTDRLCRHEGYGRWNIRGSLS